MASVVIKALNGEDMTCTLPVEISKIEESTVSSKVSIKTDGHLPFTSSLPIKISLLQPVVPIIERLYKYPCKVKIIWDWESINFDNTNISKSPTLIRTCIDNIYDWIARHIDINRKVDAEFNIFVDEFNSIQSTFKILFTNETKFKYNILPTSRIKVEYDNAIKKSIKDTINEFVEEEAKITDFKKYNCYIVIITNNSNFSDEIADIKKWGISAKDGTEGSPILLYTKSAPTTFTDQVLNKYIFNDICDPNGTLHIIQS